MVHEVAEFVHDDVVEAVHGYLEEVQRVDGGQSLLVHGLQHVLDQLRELAVEGGVLREEMP